MRDKLINALLFQAGWFACVLDWLWPAALILGVHILRHGQIRLLLSVMLFGTLLDSALTWLGVFDFSTGSQWIPLWLMLLWALLGTTLNHCLAWTAKPWWLGSLLGAVSGPLSYYAGAQLAGVGLPLGLWPSLLLLAAIWAVVLPLLHGLARRVRG
ncbi:DUF2878 domain-containing protein [Pseudomonas sp. 21LCFQ010]|uniref:DUF2878 domain-containing protein n=1 Tax=Pseudomonas sp. 21LCFQ010 TaxID=2957506 RepID=UPI002097011D|nr:DUF2878 domain-containing protein [Pseudomonas sp. 21LCFQ010]MCO8161333.1 DUF2878 domain-containing protein [Pseudomonas sp. 21LCFQ010]